MIDRWSITNKQRNTFKEQSLFSEANVLQPVKKSPAFYGSWRFITVSTTARHLSRSWARSSPCPHSVSRRFISIRLIETNLMHYLSSVYFVNQPLHVSGIFVAHHQEVYCIYTAIGTCCADERAV